MIFIQPSSFNKITITNVDSVYTKKKCNKNLGWVYICYDGCITIKQIDRIKTTAKRITLISVMISLYHTHIVVHNATHIHNTLQTHLSTQNNGISIKLGEYPRNMNQTE